MKRLLFVVLVGCRGCDEKPVSIETPVPDAAEAALSPLDGASRPLSDATRYDCAGIEPDPMTGPCTSPPAPGDDLILVNDDLSDITADHLPRASSAVWARATRALGKAEGVDPASLLPAERIALQNAALHLSRVAAKLEPAIAARAEKLVKRLAFAPEPAIAMDLELWLGPKSDWTLRSVPIVPNVHEQFFSETRSLRIVRTPTIRANFARLVAVDPSGKPFVSHVAGSIEIRRGLDKEASVCVVVLDPARIRCKLLGGLRAVRSLADLPHTPFARHDESVAKCNSCHIEEDTVVGLKLTDTFDPEHDRKLLEVLAKKP